MGLSTPRSGGGGAAQGHPTRAAAPEAPPTNNRNVLRVYSRELLEETFTCPSNQTWVSACIHPESSSALCADRVDLAMDGTL